MTQAPNKLDGMRAHTHVIEYDGGVLVQEVGGHRDVSIFANPLHRFNGRDQWALTLYALPDDLSYDQMQAAKRDPTEYLQVGGMPDGMTIEIRKPGGEQWGAKWVRYAVGHPHDGDPPLDVPIKLPRSTQMISKPEVFTADEAAELFHTYYTTGEIPSKYTLRLIEGYGADGKFLAIPVKQAGQ
jgi:hypothetical protein